MPRFGFAIDNRVCIGCHACTVACKAEHEVPLGVNRTWVKYIEKGEFPNTRRSFSVQRCNHCDDAPCVEICPVTSLYRRPDGIVDFDSDRCIGCKSCMQACPYDAIYLDPQTLTAAKCNYCTHRVDQGIEPACVVVCPVEAIVSGDLDDPNSRISLLDRTLNVQYPKVEKGTQPKLFYVGGESAALNPVEAPPQVDYLWSGSSPELTPQALESAEREAEEASRARRVYDVKAKPVPWGWMVSAYITTKALAAGAVLVSFLLFVFGQADSALPWAPGLLSLLFLGVTGALLVADLTQPKRFLYVLLRPQWKSWLVRGAYAITAFSILEVVTLIASGVGISRTGQIVVGGLTSAAAALVAAYTALLFAQARGRDYWQNPLLVVTMLIDALAAGVALAVCLGAFNIHGGIAPERAGMWIGFAVLALGVLAIAEHLPAHHSTDAARTAAIIRRGAYRTHFWGGAVFVGLILPIPLLVLSWTVPAVLCVLIGIALRNHILVQAPQRVPLS